MARTAPVRAGCCATFAVHPVTPAAKPLDTRTVKEVLARRIGFPEAFGRAGERYLPWVDTNALVSAVHLAFAEHRPLVLTPDAIWITIVQGVAQQVALDPEQWRPALVPHAGKATILVLRDDLAAGDPGNPWGEVADEFRQQIIKTSFVSDRLTADFSTTGPIERLAQAIVLMDVVSPYYKYEMGCICGIPELSLAGTAEDWELLCRKVEGLPELGLDWWLSELKPVCREFAKAASGEVDVQHWQRLYKWAPTGPYRPELSNGWILKLFPYLMDGGVRPTLRNGLVTGESPEGVDTRRVPGGISAVPVNWTNSDGSGRRLNLCAGVVGVTQDGIALKPSVNWAVTHSQHGGRA